MGRPPSNEFFMKQAWNVSDTKDLYHANGDNFDSFVRDMYRRGYLRSDKYKTYDDFARDFMDPDSSANTDGFWHGWFGASEGQAGRRNYILEQARKYYDNKGTTTKPEQVNSTPGTFTTPNGTTITTTPVTQETTGGGETAPKAEKSVNDMTTREYLDYQAQHAAEDIDTIVRTQGVTPAEARRIYYAMHGDNRYYGYRGQTPPSMQPAQQQPQGQQQQPQQPQGQPQQPQQTQQPQQPQADQQQGPRGYQGGTVTVGDNTYPANDPVTGAPFVGEAYGVPRYANKPNPPAQQAQQQPTQQPAGAGNAQALAGNNNKPLGSVKAASLARAFAAGRFSSDEAGDNKVADNRTALWNRFNGD